MFVKKKEKVLLSPNKLIVTLFSMSPTTQLEEDALIFQGNECQVASFIKDYQPHRDVIFLKVVDGERVTKASVWFGLFEDACALDMDERKSKGDDGVDMELYIHELEDSILPFV